VALGVRHPGHGDRLGAANDLFGAASSALMIPSRSGCPGICGDGRLLVSGLFLTATGAMGVMLVSPADWMTNLVALARDG
jgi:hypothetical protein